MSSGHDAENRKKNPNRLISEKSPYLLQHAYNPVDWYPWGPEAFEAAQKENKPVFLSVGYSTCHWCHVMERESFEDEEVAALLNGGFIAIKVDREERPDIDTVYMKICQLMTGSGGWPLTIIMTPDKKPFFAGTYLPKAGRYGRAGMLDLLPKAREMWAARPGDLIKLSDEITAALQQEGPRQAGDALEEATLHAAFEELDQRFDRQHAGFGSAPKFPTPQNLIFLLRYWKRTNEPKALAMVEQTLQAMRLGGIYDHIGYGFHRYSTDAKWLVPHFEKMLYDQALLTIAYTEAYLATKNEAYRQTASEVIEYVLRDMSGPEGGFYSAEDADSEGEEGKFYVWSQEEISALLGPSEAELFTKVFNTSPDGNFIDTVTNERPGTNILHLNKSLEQIAADLNISVQDLHARMDAALGKLFKVRKKRMHPHKDDKILTDWNGLMISALAKAASAFHRPDYAEAAKKAAAFFLDHLRTPEGRLLHRYREGEASLSAHIDDYAFYISGLLDLYEATFELKYLEEALELNRDFITHFHDEKLGGFYFTADDSEEILIRGKEIYDAAIPSGNSIAMLNLLRLGRLTGDPELEEKAILVGRAFSDTVRAYPAGYTQLLAAVDFAIGPVFEIVIAGDPEGDDTKAMMKALRSQFRPDAIVLFKPSDPGAAELDRLSDLAKAYGSPDGKARAYVCKDRNCLLPATTVSELLERLTD